MAETRHGAALTDAHRVAQVGLAAEAIASSRLLWPLLDPSNLAGSKPEWMALQMALMQVYDGKSASLASAYLSEYRSAELGDSSGPVAGLDDFDGERVFGSMDATGPGRIAAKEAGGMSARLAAAQAFPILAGAVQRHVLGGGRRVLAESAGRDPRAGGWRRVTDADPCTFCAMLVTRGPVYHSKAAAMGLTKYHDKCGCGVEIVYGTWRPTKQEQAYIDAYDKAAEIAEAEDGVRTYSTVLPRMRAAGTFGDSPAVLKSSPIPPTPKVPAKTPKAAPPELATLPRKTVLGTAEDDIAASNPLFHSGRQYEINCQRAVMAHEMRRLGYDVTARGNYEFVNSILWDNDITGHWIDPATGKPRPLTPVIGKSGVRAETANWPDGGRGWVTVVWKPPNNGAHIFTVEKRGNDLKFMDPQSGVIDVNHYFQMATSRVGIIRVDDQVPAAKVVDMVTGPNPTAGGV
ncbi:VG15 protein [Rhodococcoides fascians]|uniref:VG15 protein n=1 Tax=Rhodococcoides fascians TaxID=1828 RepID=UPI0006912ED7|nr:toxin glutamine deamidase domain-containing protein [Rhodococcus fascians]